MSPPAAYRPLLDFMIVGAQKCGTTALVHYLRQHPEIGMSSRKEVHLFDAPDYSPDWTPRQIDERYRPCFQHCPVAGTRYLTSTGTPTSGGTPTLVGTPTLEETPTLEGIPTSGGTRTVVRARGEATPIYIFLPDIAPALKRYNPDLKVIVLLRDPVERAISHYCMEKNRGYEHLPLWLALGIERWRLWRCRDRRGHGSAWRRHSYRRRGLYSLQLGNLCRYFDAQQVLLVRTEELARDHEVVLQRVFEFLGADPCDGIAPEKVFEGDRDGRSHPVVSCLLRLSFLPEFIRMRRFEVARARE